MYQTKTFKPTPKQKEELASLMQHPGWLVVEERAEFEHSDAWKFLLDILQSLDTTKQDDILTLEKEGIKANAVTKFLQSMKSYTQDIYSPE